MFVETEDFIENKTILINSFKQLKQHPFRYLFGAIAIYMYLVSLIILIP